MLLVTVIVVMVSIQLYMKWTLQGKYKAAVDELGQPFSPAWSNFTSTVKTHERTNQRHEANGYERSVLLDDAFTRGEPYVDDFSNRPIHDEKLYD